MDQLSCSTGVPDQCKSALLFGSRLRKKQHVREQMCLVLHFYKILQFFTALKIPLQLPQEGLVSLLPYLSY